MAWSYNTHNNTGDIMLLLVYDIKGESVQNETDWLDSIKIYPSTESTMVYDSETRDYTRGVRFMMIVSEGDALMIKLRHKELRLQTEWKQKR